MGKNKKSKVQEINENVNLIKDEKKIKKEAKKVANNDSKIILGIVAAVIIIAFGMFGFYFAKANIESCITYDGGKVSNADYEVYYKTFATMLQYYGYDESIIPREIANKAAIDAIIVELAKSENIDISDEDKAAIEEVFNDEEQLDTFVSQGIDISRMRKLYYNDYLITAYINKKVEDATAEEVAEYIKSNTEGEADMYEYNTAHILFKTIDDSGNAISDEEKATKKATAEGVLARVKNGEDFATLAKEFSEDSTASDGGKYTCYNDGYTVDEYFDAAKTLNDGEVYATLVETSYGYHIIKMESKVENGRVNNDTEREEYVDNKINNLSTERNVTIDEEKLNKLVESITGVKVSSSDEEDESEVVNIDGNTTTEETTTDGTTETENTTAE